MIESLLKTKRGASQLSYTTRGVPSALLVVALAAQMATGSYEACTVQMRGSVYVSHFISDSIAIFGNDNFYGCFLDTATAISPTRQ